VASPYKYALGAAQVCGKEEPLKVALGPSLVNLNQFISWFIVANFYNILISSSEVIENQFFNYWRKGVTVTVGINNYWRILLIFLA
jgi:hypothetical protein